MRSLLLILFCLVSMPSFSKQKAIYGKDDRVSSNSLKVKSKQRYYLRSIAAMVSKYQVKEVEGSDLVKIVGRPYEIRANICKDEDEAFKDELVISTCTGFLVGKDKLVTAAHCVINDYKCRTSKWIFDYSSNSIHSSQSVYLLKSSVYSCSEVIERVYDSQNKIDYAVIKLDRAPEKRVPLPLRSRGEVSSNEELYSLGHPQGLSLKYILNGKIRDNSSPYHFETTLDSFKGNSGSPVIGKKSGLVEGILISGEDDFTWDSKNKCKRIKKCAEDECLGESVMRISEIPSL